MCNFKMKVFCGLLDVSMLVDKLFSSRFTEMYRLKVRIDRSSNHYMQF